MLLKGRRRGHELRDLHGASRAVAYLTLASAPYAAITGALTPGIGVFGLVAVMVTAIGMAVVGTICWRRPTFWPPTFWYGAPAIACTVITLLNIGTGDSSSGAQLFFLWPVLYAANFLGHRAVAVTLALVFAGHAGVVFSLLAPSKALADWVAMTLAMSMTAVVVAGLRTRADRLREVLERQANADELTGLTNRRSLTESLTEASEWSRRTGNCLALITVDLDHFKAINDTYGHAEGDRALMLVAKAMNTVTGEAGIAARLGGDEFVMLLRLSATEPQARQAAIEVAEALVAVVSASTDSPGGPPSLSVGVALFPADASTVEELITASDAALYEAKTSGRSRIAVAKGRQNVDHVPQINRLVPNQRP